MVMESDWGRMVVPVGSTPLYHIHLPDPYPDPGPLTRKLIRFSYSIFATYLTNAIIFLTRPVRHFCLFGTRTPTVAFSRLYVLVATTLTADLLTMLCRARKWRSPSASPWPFRPSCRADSA